MKQVKRKYFSAGCVGHFYLWNRLSSVIQNKIREAFYREWREGQISGNLREFLVIERSIHERLCAVKPELEGQ